MIALLILILSYLLGSIPTGFLIGKFVAGIDLREYGSGSTGATNVLRHVGKWSALVVFLIDTGKGIGAVLISKELILSDSWQVSAGLSALAGHIWPIWLNWRGGKAVATGLGILLGLSWQVGLAALGIFLLIITFSKIVSLSSVIAAISLPILMLISFQSDFRLAYFFVSVAAMLLVLWRHRDNIKRLIKGDEPKIGQTR